MGKRTWADNLQRNISGLKQKFLFLMKIPWVAIKGKDGQFIYF